MCAPAPGMWEDDRDRRDWPEASAEVEGSQGRPDWSLKMLTGKGLLENRRLGAPTDRPEGSSQNGPLIKGSSGQIIAEGSSQDGPFNRGAPGKGSLRNDRARNRRHQKSQLERPCGKIAENRSESIGPYGCVNSISAVCLDIAIPAVCWLPTIQVGCVSRPYPAS